MYILLEGMPGTGKTTIAKELGSKLKAKYMKSVLSDTVFGDALKLIRNSDKSKDFELMLLSDLVLDELRVVHYIKQGDLVRDKSIAATLGHLYVHGYKNSDREIVEALKKGYSQLEKFAIMPDIAIYLKSHKNKVLEHIGNKTDLSEIDVALFENYDVYEKQDIAIEYFLKKIYGDRFMSLACFSGTVDNMVDSILSRCMQ